MITVPPRHYCIVENPVLRDADMKVVVDPNNQIKLRHADQVKKIQMTMYFLTLYKIWKSVSEPMLLFLKEIRLAQDPFPLYPGEVLKLNVTSLRVVMANSALRLRAVLDYEDESGEKRVAGDEWLFEGPGNLFDI